MKYGIKLLGQAPGGPVRLTEPQYLQVVSAKASLVRMLGVEQKFDLFYENYAEYERTLLDLTLNHAIRFGHSWQSFQVESAQVTRRLANLLSSARMYVDHLRHDLPSTLGQADAEAFSRRCGEQYDKVLGYRVMEALRNVMQHRDLPFIGTSHAGDREGEAGPDWRLRFRTVARVWLADLEEIGLKGRVLKELAASGRRIVAITPLVREYVAALGEVHEEVRKAAAQRVDEWESALSAIQAKATKRWRGAKGGTTIVFKIDQSGNRVDTQVFDDIGKHRVSLERKNQGLGGLSRRYVSSDWEDEDAKA